MCPNVAWPVGANVRNSMPILTVGVCYYREIVYVNHPHFSNDASLYHTLYQLDILTLGFTAPPKEEFANIGTFVSIRNV